MSIDDFAEKLIAELKKHGITVQCYHAITTNSVYLKLDYGVLHTIRISDHKGKKGSYYRYNFSQNLGGTKIQRIHANKKWTRFFAPFCRMNDMIREILRDREYKYKKLGGVAQYENAMHMEHVMRKRSKGFWNRYKTV